MRDYAGSGNERSRRNFESGILLDDTKTIFVFGDSYTYNGDSYTCNGHMPQNGIDNIPGYSNTSSGGYTIFFGINDIGFSYLRSQSFSGLLPSIMSTYSAMLTALQAGGASLRLDSTTLIPLCALQNHAEFHHRSYTDPPLYSRNPRVIRIYTEQI
ncbi:hypothetical protein JCM11641_000968 [Rhodosporidiobolus odoratus]